MGNSINDNTKDNKNTETWKYGGEYKNLEDNIAPLFHCIKNNPVHEGAIIIDPEKLMFYTDNVSRNHCCGKDHIYENGHIVKISIPENINGVSLIEILKHENFINLLNTIKKFTNWLEYDFDIKNKVDEVECGYEFIKPIKFIDNDGLEVQSIKDNHQDIERITICNGKYYILSKTDINLLVHLINKHNPDLCIVDLEIELRSLYNEYF